MKQYVLSIADDVDANLSNGVITMLKNLPFVDLSETTETLQKINNQRQFGQLKGKIWISEDFDKPMEEFEEYM